MPNQVLRGVGWLATAFVLAMLVAAAPSAAQVVDDDGDGVADEVDDCLDTPPADLVDETGCSICPCEEISAGVEWTSHRQYVGCVAGAAKAKALRPRARREAVKHAKLSTCGSPALTRCCSDVSDADGNTRSKCLIMAADRCNALGDAADENHDFRNLDDEDGPGSCLGNPCAD